MSISAFPSPWADRFRDLPVLHVKPSPMTDDDIDFHSDMMYFRDLLNQIILQASLGGHRSPWPDDLSRHFAWLEAQAKDV